jgi:hypothetical protein
MTKEIPLSKGKVAIVDDCDYEYLSQFKWRAKVSANTCYAVRWTPYVDGKRVFMAMHREILNAPKGMDVDHANGNGLDNRRENIRLCSKAENNCNVDKRTTNTSGYKGVYWNSRMNKWYAKIGVDGQQKYLGSFSRKEDAALAYDRAAPKYHGQFAQLNSLEVSEW